MPDEQKILQLPESYLHSVTIGVELEMLKSGDKSLVIEYFKI